MKNKLKNTKLFIAIIAIITILSVSTIYNKETIINTISSVIKTEGNEDNRVLYGSVVGIDEEDYDKAIIILYNSVNSYTKQLNENFEYNFTDITDGDYYLKIEIEGYKIPSPESIKITNGETINKDITITKMEDSDFFYQWKADDTYFGYEESATVPEEKKVTFINEEITISDTNAAYKLYKDYKIILSNEEEKWSIDYTSRMYDIINNIYSFPRSKNSKWILTNAEIDDDIEIIYQTEGNVVKINKKAFENATPRKAEYNGLKGTFFSNRLYHALIRYATKNGEDTTYINRLLKNNYGVSIIVDDYTKLTKDTTKETAAAFEEFKPEELLAILEMFAEMPDGFDKVENLEYLVRRVDGSVNPLHPNAAAISWVNAEYGFIEFIDSAFLGDEIDDTFRLILHEKTHFLWEHKFNEELKNEWIKIGGWYETEEDPDGWSTTKETEFVTAYSHAINPNEDMAESVAYYVLAPERLESRSPAKYEFIKNYIMNGEIYISQIREDLTFEVYNLYPDYQYPGRIIGVDVDVTGAPEEDKKVTVTVELDTQGDVKYGATKAYTRISSEIGTFYDLYLHPINEDKSILKGTITFDKHSYNGYWYSNEIELTDQNQNQRFVGTDNFGWKLYINNTLYDDEPPVYIENSLRVEQEKSMLDGREVTLVHVKYKATDNIAIDTVFARMSNDTYNGYEIDEYGTYNEETQEATITFVFTEYMQSGTYSIKHISIRDKARNKKSYYFYSDGSGSGTGAPFEYESENSDYEPPEINLNNIIINATPTHPENPNGETVVTIDYFAKDNLSGLGSVYFTLRDPLGKIFSEYHYHENYYTTFFNGDPTAWTNYRITIILPEGSTPGKWGLQTMNVEDKAGNHKNYNFLEIVHFVIDKEQNNSTYKILPEIESIKVGESQTLTIENKNILTEYVWEITNRTGTAEINQDGELTALTPGYVTVKVYEKNDVSKYGTKNILITSDTYKMGDWVIEIEPSANYNGLAKRDCVEENCDYFESASLDYSEFRIIVKNLPIKTKYLERKDKLDLTGGKVDLSYTKNITITKDMSATTVTGFDNTKVGTQELYVNYNNKTEPFEIEIIEKEVENIVISNLPTKLKYLESKDTLNLEDGILQINYNNDTVEFKELKDVDVTGFDNIKTGKQTLTVTYKDKTTTFEVEVIAKELVSIEIFKEPTKTEYLESKDNLDLTGAELKLNYNNDTTATINLSEATVTGFDHTKVGKQTLTVTYKDKTATFEVEVIAKELVSIAISKEPTKTEYLEGKDELDLTGGELKLNYNNDTTSTINLSEATVTGFNNTKIGKQTLTITYKEKTTTFEVEVIAKELVSIEISKQPNKTKYLESKDNLDLTGGELKLNYNNDTTSTISLSKATVTGFDNTKIGKQTLTVTYETKTTTFEVEVIAKELVSIEISKLPNKTKYLESKDELDLTGGLIKLNYNNDTSSTLDLTEKEVTGFDNTKVGKQTVTVTYETKTTTFEVEIIAKELVSVEISKEPTKTEYLEGKDELDLTGGELKLNYNNDTTSTINLSEATVTGFDNTKVGKQNLTVTYKEKTTTFEVEVIAKELVSIEIFKEPTKTEYLEGKDELDLTGGELKLNYNNDTTSTISLSEATVTGFDYTKTGKQTLTVTYKEKTTTFEVEVIAKELVSIEIFKEPTKTEYLEGKDDLDLTGGELKLNYNNDSTSTISLSEATVTGFDYTKTGKQTLTVTYKEKTATFEVEVIAKELVSIEISKLPNKTKYLESKDELDLTGGRIKLNYNNDTSSSLDLTETQVTGFNNTKIGKQTLTVTYKGKTTTLEIEITEKEIVSIEVSKLPNKTKYLESKENLDLTDGQVKIYYDNNTTGIINLSETEVTGFDNTKVGKQTLTVTYETKTTIFEVEIIAKELVSIKISKLPNKTEYLESKDNLDLTGGELKLNYNNDTTSTINLSEATVTGFNNTKVGKQTITVAHKEKTTTFEVEIIAKELVSIEISKKPTKTEYLEGKDELDLTGGQIKLNYDNDTSSTLDLTETKVTGFDNTKIGKQTLTVTYKEKTTTFEVEIIAKELVSIEISKLPNKTKYLESKDILDLTGGQIKLNYNNDTSSTLDLTETEVTGFDYTKVGKQTLTVTYKGKTTTLEIEITEKKLTSIEMSKQPTKTKYLESKENLDLTGGKITLNYNNNTTAILDLVDTEVTGFDNTIIGPQTLTITYQEKITTFEVEIIAKELSSIEISKLPNKLEYLEGKDVLDLFGGELKLNYNNDTTSTIILSEATVTGFDNTKVGKQILTATYEEKTTTFEIEIEAKTLESIKVTTLPNKIEYLIDEEFVQDGIIVNAIYNNGTQTPVLDFEITGFDSATIGEKTLTVTYQEKMTTFKIEIKKYVAEELTSTIYTITNNIISRIKNGTNKNVLFNNLNNSINYKLYKNDDPVEENLPISTGMKLKLIYKETLMKVYTLVVTGDTNGDGEITPLDYVRIKNHIMGNPEISGEEFLLAADANSDGEISPLDYVRIKNQIMNGDN